MKRSILCSAVLAGILALPFTLQVSSQETTWRNVSIEGVNYQVALNRVVDIDMPGDDDRREVFLYIDPKSFSPESVRKVFLDVARKYQKPIWLDIELFSDKQALQISMKLETSDAIMHFANSPEGRAARTRWYERFGKFPDEYLSARYTRIERDYYSKRYIEEEYYYTPSADSERMLKIQLRTKPAPPYSGTLNRDIVIAVNENDLQKVEDLVTKGARVNSVDDDGDSIPMIAVLSVRDLSLVQTLLKAGADVNYRNKKNSRGQNALVLAASAKNLEVFKALVEAGADINAQNGYGYSPLIMASVHGELDMVKLLLSRKADVKLKDVNGKTAFDLAKTKEVRELIAKFEATQPL